MIDDRNIRRFLETALASALDLGLVTEEELVATVGPERLIEHLSVEARARLLTAFLEADEVGCELLIRTVGIATLAANAPATLLWRAVTVAGRRAVGHDVDSPDLRAALEPSSDLIELDVDARGSAPSTRAPEGSSVGSSVGSSAGSSAGSIVGPSGSADDTRKPNRRVRGAGATSRRRRESTPPPPQTANEAPTAAMFVASRRGGGSHRAATEPAMPPDDIAEIEIIDETDVAFTPPPTNGKRK